MRFAAAAAESLRERESRRENVKLGMVQIVWETHPLSFVSSSFRLLECGRRKIIHPRNAIYLSLKKFPFCVVMSFELKRVKGQIVLIRLFF